MKQVIDINHWNRKEHFEFFSSFDDPFWGTTLEIDFTGLYHRSRQKRQSFFLSSLHAIMKCANATEAFRLRTDGKGVIKYHKVGVSPTIGRDDGTFGFGFFDYDADFETFAYHASQEIRRVKECSGLAFPAVPECAYAIRYSSLPWFSFSEMKHAGSFKTGDSAPRISTGRLIEKEKRLLLPISITVHHGLVDGLHVGEFVKELSLMTKG
ncbi:chloramphenicol acetyltransferase [Bacteroidaceae bacterium]|uniref:chloramphenicol acetyltransferase n=1 Tax=Prevotella sp. MGM2 TaxID=2033406 RepID=UPI000CEA2486|nr:chloramphenicol acetyltransferase [Prevotella sp. MGM2]GFI33850.1 chloramphenicol acetyltransferase [Bacteroidaceae bacterium]